MALKLVLDAPKGSRPKAGQLYLMKTTLGYIPVGVTSTEAFFGAAAMIHPYRALISDPSDTSWFLLVEKKTNYLFHQFRSSRVTSEKADLFKESQRKAILIPSLLTTTSTTHSRPSGHQRSKLSSP